MAADKLRHKLQSLEDQIIDKQNRYTIEKNNWETQKLQFVSTINRVIIFLNILVAVKNLLFHEYSVLNIIKIKIYNIHDNNSYWLLSVYIPI